jgi:hypothetical protein
MDVFFKPPAGDVPEGWSAVPKTLLRAVEKAVRSGPIPPEIQPVVDALVARQAFVFNVKGARHNLRLEVAEPGHNSRFLVRRGWQQWMMFTSPVYMRTAVTNGLVSVGATKIDFKYLRCLSNDALYTNIRTTMIVHEGAFIDLDTKRVNGMDTEVWAAGRPSMQQLGTVRPEMGVRTLRKLMELHPQPRLYVTTRFYDAQAWRKSHVASLRTLAKRVVEQRGTHAQRDFVRTSEALARVPTFFGTV